jgi:tetratricopeptide (TPR) repeat protein
VLVDAEVSLRLDDLEAAERLYLEVLEHAETPEQRAAGLAGMGQVAFRRGMPSEAISRIEQALDLYGERATDHPSLGDTLGRAYATVGELASAIDVFQRFLDAVRAGNDFIETVRFAVLLSNALVDRGSFGEAERVLGQTLALAKDSRDPILRARLYWSQSRLHAEQNDHHKAARYARRALEILELTEQALELLREGWPLLAESGTKLEQAQYRLEEARALAALGRRDEAASMAMSISGLLTHASPEDAGRSYGVLAQIFESAGDTSRALELYELAAELLERNPNRYLVDVYSRLADLLEREGRRDEAYRALRRAVGVQVEIGARPAVGA